MIWLAGNRGMLGADVEAEIRRSSLPYVATDADIDITDEGMVRGFAGGKNIDWIINCAAYTAVDAAEDDHEKAFAINASGVANIGRIAAACGAKVIHISTDYVFDGAKDSEYAEDDLTSPLGAYGASKLEGERLLMEAHTAHFIIRTSWLYGRHGKNFVCTMLRLFGEKDEVRVVDDQWGSPTWTADLARAILHVVRSGSSKYGVYHYSGEGKTSWYEFAREIYDTAKKNGLVDRDVRILPIKTEDYPTRAARPKNSYLSKNKIRRVFNIDIPPWKESLGSFMKEIGPAC